MSNCASVHPLSLGVYATVLFILGLSERIADLADPARLALEPALMLGGGLEHTPQGRALFDAFGGSAPDRWGRNLRQRDEHRRVQAQGCAPSSLGEVDFLLGVRDIACQGALRFKETPDGPFLASSEDANVQPLIRLGELLNAATRVSVNREDDGDLRLILAPGSFWRI